MGVSEIGALVGMGSSIAGAVGGSGSSTPSAPGYTGYTPKNLAAADALDWSNIQQQAGTANPYTANQAQYSNILNGQLNNPYAAAQQTAANTSGTQLGAVGQQAYSNAGQLGTAAQASLPYGNQILQTAFDPQQQLFRQQQQQLQDQVRAANAAAGISTSGAGAGLEGQAMTNFDLNWQNQQLARQAQGLQAYDSNLGATGQAMAGSAQLGATGAQDTLNAGTVPYATYNANLQNQEAALNSYGQDMSAGQQFNQQTIQDLMQYMGLGTSSAQAQYAAQNSQYQNQLAAQQAQQQGLGNLFGTVGNSLGTLYGSYNAGQAAKDAQAQSLFSAGQ